MSTTGTIPPESKSAKKRKNKPETPTVNGGAATPTVESTAAEMAPTTNGADSHGESPFIKDLTK